MKVMLMNESDAVLDELRCFNNYKFTVQDLLGLGKVYIPILFECFHFLMLIGFLRASRWPFFVRSRIHKTNSGMISNNLESEHSHKETKELFSTMSLCMTKYVLIAIS